MPHACVRAHPGSASCIPFPPEEPVAVRLDRHAADVAVARGIRVGIEGERGAQRRHLVGDGAGERLACDLRARRLEVRVDVMRRRAGGDARVPGEAAVDPVQVWHPGGREPVQRSGGGPESDRQDVQVLPEVDVVVASAAHRSGPTLGLLAQENRGVAGRVALDRRLVHDIGATQVRCRASVRMVLDLHQDRRPVEPRLVVERQPGQRTSGRDRQRGGCRSGRRPWRAGRVRGRGRGRRRRRGRGACGDRTATGSEEQVAAGPDEERRARNGDEHATLGE